LAISRTLFVDKVDLAVAESIVAHLDASDAQMKVAQLRVLGGAVSRVPADATAYAHRNARIMVNVATFYSGAEDHDRRKAWVEDFAALLRQGDDGAYVNFLADEGEERIRAAYPGATWDRLAAIKARYDPDNVFRRNQNIPPAAGSS
jgi:FAD/FMN-containing dehydrogenase